MTLGREKVATHPRRLDREIQTSHASTTVRRLSGQTADELYLLCRPLEPAARAARQSEAVYRALLEVLASEGVGAEAVVSETLFFGRIGEDFDAVLDGRRTALSSSGCPAYRAATTYIGQPPLAEQARLELSAVALVPHRWESWSASEVGRSVACSCPACESGARAGVVQIGDQTRIYAGGICGAGPTAFDEAYDMFRVGEDLLGEAGMNFRDVVRTWIYVRDIDRDYDALNEARREFFRHCRIELKPASTGVGGMPFPDAHDFSLSFYALESARPLQITAMSSTTLNEAWTYGADFSRGLRVVDENGTSIYVSGTASIGERGQTVGVGDFEAQAERMLHNIASLLEAQGAGFDDLVSAVTYLKNRSDAPALRRVFREHGFDGVPCALVEAPLCRPELLCETEAVAVLPPGA
jgi:enamine deaminase RidA (YjgF/YER057c/UK114 family)